MRVRAPGVSRTSERTLSTTDSSSPASNSHPGVQRLLEVQFAAHRRGRHLGDLILAARVRREQLDDLVLDEGGIHIHHHQPLGPAVQPGRDHGDVHAQQRGLRRQGGAQR